MKYFFSLETICMIIRLAIPLIMVSLSSTISELAGIISLGTEGLMLFGAFGAVLGSYYTSNAIIGLLSGILFGVIFSILFSILCIKFKANQTVCGVGLNLFGYGFTAVGTFIIFKQEGISAKVTQLPLINIPILKNIPLIGDLFYKQSIMLYLTIIIVIFLWYILKYHKIGLRLKGISDYPLAVKSVGINVTKYRYISMAIAGGLAGLGGAYLSIVQNNVFVNGMTAGRGFLGVAANIFGGWTITGSVGASFIFATAQAIRFNLIGFKIPDQFIQMIPYIITIIALILFGNRVNAPKALGKIQD